jgi:predicted ATP-binding protein involved in virulence
MRIDRLKITNFKAFSEREFTLHPEFNLVVGLNGSGKTSVLSAIAVALGGWAHAYNPEAQNQRPIEANEVREIQRDQTSDKMQMVRIEAWGNSDLVDRNGAKKPGEVNWQREWLASSPLTKTHGTIAYINNGKASKPYPISFSSVGSDILNYIDKGEDFTLPLIAFYGCDRLWLAKQDIVLNEEIATARPSRFDAYIDCFHTAADHKTLGQWLLKQALASSQKQEITPRLEIIKQAAIAALENCTDLRFDFEESRVMVDFADGSRIAFEHLSDGQRTMLGLFCDIARRASILNPHLGVDCCAQTSGIVLIDELDLHLHPKWQRQIIEDLRRIFPKIQFICSSHSPFLIQSLRTGEELLMLDGQPTADLANLSIEDISRGLMGVSHPEVSEKYQHTKTDVHQYLELLEEAKLQPAEKLEAYEKQLAQQLTTQADNPALQALLEIKRISILGK